MRRPSATRRSTLEVDLNYYSVQYYRMTPIIGAGNSLIATTPMCLVPELGLAALLLIACNGCTLLHSCSSVWTTKFSPSVSICDFQHSVFYCLLLLFYLYFLCSNLFIPCMCCASPSHARQLLNIVYHHKLLYCACKMRVHLAVAPCAEIY